MKAKRGLTIRWRKGPHFEHVPFTRDAVIIFRDRFGTVHVTMWGPRVDAAREERLEKAIRKVIVAADLNPVIEP